MKEKIPIISHAMLVGDKAKFLCMLLTLKVMTFLFAKSHCPCQFWGRVAGGAAGG